MTGRRSSLRESLIQAIREAALAELRRVGPAELSLREVARAAKISPSGLYRYVDGRDGLLELLIADAFTDYGQAISTAIHQAGAGFPDQLAALAATYYHWAKNHPEQFALILGSPVTGFHPAHHGPTGAAARAFGAPMLALFGRAHAQRQLCVTDPLGPAVDLTAFGAETGAMPTPILELAIRSWARIHGLVILELFGHLSWSGRDIEQLLAAEVQAIVATCQ